MWNWNQRYRASPAFKARPFAKEQVRRDGRGIEAALACGCYPWVSERSIASNAPHTPSWRPLALLHPCNLPVILSWWQGKPDAQCVSFTHDRDWESITSKPRPKGSEKCAKAHFRCTAHCNHCLPQTHCQPFTLRVRAGLPIPRGARHCTPSTKASQARKGGTATARRHGEEGGWKRGRREISRDSRGRVGERDGSSEAAWPPWALSGL